MLSLNIACTRNVLVAKFCGVDPLFSSSVVSQCHYVPALLCTSPAEHQCLCLCPSPKFEVRVWG